MKIFSSFVFVNFKRAGVQKRRYEIYKKKIKRAKSNFILCLSHLILISNQFFIKIMTAKILSFYCGVLKNLLMYLLTFQPGKEISLDHAHNSVIMFLNQNFNDSIWYKILIITLNIYIKIISFPQMAKNVKLFSIKKGGFYYSEGRDEAENYFQI